MAGESRLLTETEAIIQMPKDDNASLARAAHEDVALLTAERDLLADAIHPNRKSGATEWTAEMLARLASCHRDDSLSVDETGTGDSYCMSYDYEAVGGQLRQRAESAEKRFAKTCDELMAMGSSHDAMMETLAQVKALRSIVQERRKLYGEIADNQSLGEDMRAQHHYSEMMLHSFDTWLGQIFGDVSPHGSVYDEVKRRAANQQHEEHVHGR
jgi:hypothetical protein